MQDPAGHFNESEIEGAMVVPLVLCKTNGGPYDDEAFLAGFNCGSLSMDLKVSKFLEALPKPRIVDKAILRQVDLLCMSYGYTACAYQIPNRENKALVVFGYSTTTEDLP